MSARPDIIFKACGPMGGSQVASQLVREAQGPGSVSAAKGA